MLKQTQYFYIIKIKFFYRDFLNLFKTQNKMCQREFLYQFQVKIGHKYSEQAGAELGQAQYKVGSRQANVIFQ